MCVCAEKRTRGYMSNIGEEIIINLSGSENRRSPNGGRGGEGGSQYGISYSVKLNRCRETWSARRRAKSVY